MKMTMIRSKSFLRGFGSAFDLFPSASRQDRRQVMRCQNSANFILSQAWERVGNSLYSAMGEYDTKEKHPRTEAATSPSVPSKAA
jgi:hypothetical protein